VASQDQLIQQETVFDGLGGRHHDLEKRYVLIEFELRDRLLPVSESLELEVDEVVIDVSLLREIDV